MRLPVGSVEDRRLASVGSGRSKKRKGLAWVVWLTVADLHQPSTRRNSVQDSSESAD